MSGKGKQKRRDNPGSDNSYDLAMQKIPGSNDQATSSGTATVSQLPKIEPATLPKQNLFSRNNCVSLFCNTMLLTGTGLSFFAKPGLQIAGAIANGLGFFTKQIHDGIENQAKRVEITKHTNVLDKNLKDIVAHLGNNQLDDIVKTIIGDKNLTTAFKASLPSRWIDRYGLERTFTLYFFNFINLCLQASAVGVSIYQNTSSSNTESNDQSNPGLNYYILAATVIGYALDAAEQHLKKDNLERQQIFQHNIEVQYQEIQHRLGIS